MAMIIILCLIWARIIEKKIFQSSNPLYPRDLHELSKPHNEVSNFKKKKIVAGVVHMQLNFPSA